MALETIDDCDQALIKLEEEYRAGLKKIEDELALPLKDSVKTAKMLLRKNIANRRRKLQRLRDVYEAELKHQRSAG